MRPVRVVIDARMTDGIPGGVQQWVIGLASALSKLDGAEDYLFLVNQGHQDWLMPYLGGRCSLLIQPVKVGQVKSDPARPETGTRRDVASISAVIAPGGSPVRRIRRALAARFPILRRVRRRLRQPAGPRWLSPLDRTVVQAGADLVHFPMQSAFPTSLPSIYQPWDLQHVHLPEFFSEEHRERRDRSYRASCTRASLIVVATEWIKADVSAQFDIAPQRIAVVNPPPVTDAYVLPTAGEEEQVAHRLALPAQFLLYPAQAWGHKNHERLFEALQLLRARGIEARLVCTGHPNERSPELVRLARDLGLEAQIRFLGYVDPTEIQVLYRRATALVFPSLYEGWGLPIMEAFAAGLAVACSNVTSLPELVGDAALVFDPHEPADIASAIERLWTDEGLRGRLVERGHSRVAKFDWNRTARIMRAHYRCVAGRTLDPEDLALVGADPLV